MGSSSYGTSGHVWQGVFKSFIIQEDHHLLIVLRYVEGNPLKAGLVSSPQQWLWSSHKERVGGKPRALIDKNSIELPDNWSRYVDDPLTEKELEMFRQSVNRQSPYGTPIWQMYVSRKLGLESTLRPRGRSMKQVKKV